MLMSFRSVSSLLTSDWNPGALSTLTVISDGCLIALVVAMIPSLRSSACSELMRDVVTKSEKESLEMNINCLALLITSETKISPGFDGFVIEVNCSNYFGNFLLA